MSIPSNSHLSNRKRVIVVGAGWAGLAAAKTYLQVDPSIDLTIVDAEATLGGVWAKERIYPCLITDSPCGYFDFSDMPMGPIVGLKNLEEIPGEKVYEYLSAWADKHHLTERMRLRTRVTKLTRNANGTAWDVMIEYEGMVETLTCDKLILATGLASQPNLPEIPRDSYNGVVCHSKNIDARYTELAAEKVRNVTVYGGCKSAIEAVTLSLDAGKHVDWVVRDVGNGPGMMVKLRKLAVLFVGRWKSIMSPSIFATSGFCYNFLHSGKSDAGSWVTRKIWETLTTSPFQMDPYNPKSANTERLIPEWAKTNVLWSTTSICGLHEKQNQFVEHLHSGVMLTVHRASITSLSGNSVTLTSVDGSTTTLPSDATIFATGWLVDAPFVSHDPLLAFEIGLPTPISSLSVSETEYWSSLDSAADKFVCATLPVLSNPPDVYIRPQIQENTPFRLYRHILPPELAAKGDRSLIHLGLLTTLQHSTYAEVSALWGVAWMEGMLLPSSDPAIKAKREMDEEVAKVNAWCARRYLGRGSGRQIAAGEIVEVIDLLMTDLGLNPYRKDWFGLKDMFVLYKSQDYTGIVNEVLVRRGKRG